MDILSKFTIPVLVFAATVLFGFWLSRQGKPYNGFLFNVHKLIALGAVILSALEVYRALRAIDLQGSLLFTLVIAGISVIALFASGALMSADKGEYRAMKTIHHVAPFAAVISMGYAVYLL